LINGFSIGCILSVIVDVVVAVAVAAFNNPLCVGANNQIMIEHQR
jgi:hypothetical protein